MESLAVKYRPKDFSDVCSQKSIVDILSRQIETNLIKNSYIFYGASGCGKTTCARIFANRINNGLGSPIEIDAASNNGVDNVKQIISSASERALDCTYKVYIIDEAHALTSQAWQAFLKCIEEPPKYTVFIFCTTEKNKIPETIKNRCMVFNFNLIPTIDIYNRLEYICLQEGYTDYRETCSYIARISNGCMREAISLLEKVAEYDKKVSLENALKVLGSVSYDTYFNLLNNIIDGNLQEIVLIINDVSSQGNDLVLFVNRFLEFCLDIAKYTICNSLYVTKLPASEEKRIRESINFDNSVTYYNYLIDKLLELKNMLKTDIDPKTTVTVKLMSIARCQ